MGGRSAAPLSADEVQILQLLASRKWPGTVRASAARSRLFRMGLIESERSTYATKSEGVNYTLTAAGRGVLAGLVSAS